MNIIIDSENFSATVAGDSPNSAIVLPIHTKSSPFDQTQFSRVIYFHCLYPAVHREDARKGVKDVAYCLSPPDQWLVALGVIMWQGIVEGFTWDVIKGYVNLALINLRAAGVAPEKTGTRTKSKTEMRFGWVSYSDNGRKRREMYLDLKRHYESLPEQERDAITKSLTQAKTKRKKKDT